MKTLKKNITFKVNGKKINYTNFESLDEKTKEDVKKSNPKWFEDVVIEVNVVQELQAKIEELTATKKK